MKIIITYKVCDKPKKINEKAVIDSVQYFACEDRDIISNLRDIHNIQIDEIGVEIKRK